MKTYSEQLKVDLTGSDAFICQSHDISDHQQQRVEICAQLTAQYKLVGHVLGEDDVLSPGSESYISLFGLKVTF